MRQVLCSDSTEWIKGITQMDSVITSLPDREETTLELDAWKKWFVEMVRTILLKTRDYAVFYQTDRKIDGGVLSKADLLLEAARQAGVALRFHKIVLRRAVGKIDLFRPTYTHLMCFSKHLHSGKATPDVFERGDMTYPNAMGARAVQFVCKFIKDNSETKTIYDPFCGQGSVLAIAEKFGFNSVGVEILPEQCEKARTLAVKLAPSKNELSPNPLH